MQKLPHEDRDTERRWPCEDGGSYWSDAATSHKEHWAHQELEEARTDPPLEASKGTNPANTLILDF